MQAHRGIKMLNQYRIASSGTDCRGQTLLRRFSLMPLLEAKHRERVRQESLITSISTIMSSVTTVDIEQENFMEMGSFLYRVSTVIMVLDSANNFPPNATEILQSLSINIDLAMDLVRKCSTGAESITDSQLKDIIKQIEEVIRNIGWDLSSILSSTYEKHSYVEIAIHSLSREMKNARFQMHQCNSEEPKVDNSFAEEREGMEENRLVQVSKEHLRTNNSDAQSSDMPRLMDFLKGMYYRTDGSSSQSFNTLSQFAEQIEPLYDTFFCPLTKKIMDDPVTIESGVTYERMAITEWFEKVKDGSEVLVCPTTGVKLKNMTINTNIALKTTIGEWQERNEATRITVARTALSLASSEAMVLDAIQDLQILRRKRRCRVQMHNIGITKLLTRFLEHEKMKVRCRTLDLIRLLAEDEEEKVIIAKTEAITITINMLSSSHPSEKHASLIFLLELSRSEVLCEYIGSVAGCILMLITIKYNELDDPSAAEKAGETLKNLEKFPKNIKYMADHGLLEPLVNHLNDGYEEMQMEMVSYLSELVLGNEQKTYIAERASSTLIKMVREGNTLARKAAFKALVHISSYQPNSKQLIGAGVVPVMIQEMFMRKIQNELVDSKEESATVLVNILRSGASPESLQVNKHGQTMTSDYVIYNITRMLKSSIPDKLNGNLIKILLLLSKLPDPLSTIVSAIRNTKVIYTIIEFLNSPEEELIVASASLLINLSSQMGHAIAEELCKTKGQPESLLEKPENDQITKNHAISVNLLAKLPHQNLRLNHVLLRRGTVPVVLQRIHEIKRGEKKTSPQTRHYLEGLVGILVRFTTTLYDHEILQMAIEKNLASVLTELLTADSDEVQRLAAIGLENLSLESINLSKPPKMKRTKRSNFLICLGMNQLKPTRVKLCLIHHGECSASTTFCLLETRAVEKLLSCLENRDPGVVEAALSAICTLLDERVDAEKSVEVLSRVNAVGRVLGVLGRHREDRVWKKTFWFMERFLVSSGGRSVNDISSDKELSSALLSAFDHGSSSTGQVADRVLRHLNMMPHSSNNLNV